MASSEAAQEADRSKVEAVVVEEVAVQGLVIKPVSSVVVPVARRTLAVDRVGVSAVGGEGEANEKAHALYNISSCKLGFRACAFHLRFVPRAEAKFGVKAFVEAFLVLILTLPGRTKTPHTLVTALSRETDATPSAYCSSPTAHSPTLCQPQAYDLLGWSRVPLSSVLRGGRELLASPVTCCQFAFREESPNPAEGQGRAFPTPGAEERGRTYPVPRAGGRTYPVPRAAEGTTYQVPPLAEERARTASVPLAGGRTYTVPLAEELGRTYPIPPPEELRRPFYPTRASTPFEGEEWRRANSPPQTPSSYTTPGNPPFSSAPQASAPYTTMGNPPYSSFPQASSYTTMGNPPYSTAPQASASYTTTRNSPHPSAPQASAPYTTMGNPPNSSFPQASSYATTGNPSYSSAPQATASYTTTPPHWQDTTMPDFRAGLSDDEDPRLHALRGHMIQITNSLLKLEGDLIHLTEQVQKFQQERREKESIRDDLLRKLQNAGMRV
ncbi:hypothetical protein BT69DRAFT_1397990 [Atractiella rhizophila]|nr:hypothetical protein BT69DRAFT_1397990 [Atractiella rhizophila]